MLKVQSNIDKLSFTAKSKKNSINPSCPTYGPGQPDIYALTKEKKTNKIVKIARFLRRKISWPAEQSVPVNPIKMPDGGIIDFNRILFTPKMSLKSIFKKLFYKFTK